MRQFHIHNITVTTQVNGGNFSLSLSPGFYYSPHESLQSSRVGLSVAGPFDSETEAVIDCCKMENGIGNEVSIEILLTQGCPSWQEEVSA